ncbi:MAG: DUF2784 domain-containing protein [Gemmatimonadales bacterium]
MLLRVAADLLVVVHLGFVIFVVVGGFMAWRWRRLAWLHVPAALWGALIEFMGWTCPLTPWEVLLRRAAGQTGYEGGFIEHYLIPVIYPEQLTRPMQLALGGLVVLLNCVAYFVYFRRKRV